MTNFLQKLMFWRKSPDDQTSRRASDDTSLTPAELEYEAEREEQLLQERREQDDVAP
jgi:hypothetical protein